MITNLERKSSEELFGDLAYCKPYGFGSLGYLKVASDTEFLHERVRDRGLNILNYTEELYAIYENGQTFNQYVTVWCFPDGVWVSEEELERYKSLIGVENDNNQ